MVWIAWTLSDLIPILLFSTTALAWWTSPKSTRLNLIAAAGAVIFSYAVAPDFSQRFSTRLYLTLLWSTASFRVELAVFALKNWKMLLTGAAVAWLARRAWQTLWKPVPELINILGVEVPDAPCVVLAGIRSDAATLNWTHPAANRPVKKFLIQVNGVNVGEVGASQEPAIVVSGLKPDHFYNIRVIAVGSNNFQAGSQVVRLRTIDQLQTSRDEATRNDQSLPELTERFEDIRRETEETIALICKEESENERLLTDLENDKAKQKGEREKKDAQTNSLRQEVNASDRDMRQALNRKAALERKVKEKVDEKVKMEESMSNMEKEIREFKEEAESFGQQRRDLERERDKSQESLREKLQSLQDACTQLEAQLKDKREKVKELERLWQHTHRALQDQLTHLQRANKHLEDRLRVLGNQVQHIPAQNVGMYSQVNSSVLDLDYGMLPRFKRRTFIGSFFKPKPEKDGKETGRDKEKARSKDKDKPKDRSKDRTSVEVDSPSDARQSRDSFSLHTQTSVSESRDSVSLDQSVSNMSNTPSDPSMPATVAGSIKDEGVVRKLFRKGSSSKFGRSGRLGGKDAGSIFKKGPGSSANSEKGGPSTEWSSTGDAEETQQQAMTLGATTLSAADDASGFLARSYDSMTNSPNLGPLSSGNTNSAGRGSGSKEGKTSSVRWLSNFSKKGRKEKESLDLDQERTPESDAAAAAE
ncbi:hypothetical protein P8C59_008009 [Phyllachora maydis]|uniref:Fibronectin type-III domain-containing protein n=1 Tax=Phyllachora maydis TaxID=1825666 RepID=A0AAD9I9L8_9PEZI|nr:hypothetical protein P8C59_008009 [Phyllachora maydis]